MRYASVFFLHLPKTGGTTMRRVLDREYRGSRCYEIGTDITGDIRAFRAGQWNVHNAPRLVQGHMSYGLHQFVPGPATYVTLLREPLSRALSDYYYVTSNPHHPIHERVKDMGLVEYLDSGITEQLSNGQVRLVSGDHAPGDPGVAGNRVMDRTDLELALENLCTGFAAVGLLERFDETLLLFRQRLGWQFPFYLRENVARRPYRMADVAPNDLAHIRELNRLDIELYESVREMFERRIAEQGAGFGTRLAAFRVLNRAWGVLARGLPPAARRVGGNMRRALRRNQLH